MSNSPFAKNLRTMCNRYPSVAHVCRSLRMNRQQFNKYLSGQVYPSRHNLARICELFKIDENLFMLEEQEFECIANAQTNTRAPTSVGAVDQAIASLPNDVQALSRYEGYYHSYFHALGFPGMIVRNLLHLYRKEDQFFTKSIEHLWEKENPQKHRRRFKYKGIALYLADRIFITEYETLTRHTICHTILFPSYRNAIETLSGITTGVGSLNSHMPKATRIEYEYLGRQVDLREALNCCGLYDPESPEIDAEIKERVNNKILPHGYMLTALAQ